MVQFTTVQQSVMNAHLDTFEGKINITQMVRDIGLPVSGWVAVNNYVKEYMANPPQIDGIPELVLGNMVDLPDVVAGDPFPMPTKLNMEMDINETKLADYEDSLREQLEVIEAGRNGYQAWLRAIRLLR